MVDVKTVLTKTELLELEGDGLMEDDRREEKILDDDTEDWERIVIICFTYQKPFWWNPIRIRMDGFSSVTDWKVSVVYDVEMSMPSLFCRGIHITVGIKHGWPRKHP